MKLVTRNPAGIYPSGDQYVHGLEVQAPSRWLFVSGTMGLAPDKTPADTVEAQLVLIWSNIRAILEEAGMTLDNVVRVTSYLRDASYRDANAAARVTALAGRLVPTTVIVAETLVESWLVEIEVAAAA